LTQIDGDGFVAAAFRHRTSREGDPHLHTHVVIANLVHSPDDGRWSALDGRPVLGWAKTAGYLYEAELRWQLSRRLGVEWGPVRKGIADVDGIPRRAIREFSQRRQQIEDHLDERGLSTAKAAQVAAYATRKAKDMTVPAEGLVESWRHRAETVGLDAAVLAGVCEPRNRWRVIQPTAQHLFGEMAAPTGLTAKRSTFGRRDVIQAICQNLPAGAPVEEVLAMADGFLGSAHVVALGDTGRQVMYRADGTVAPAKVDDVRFTTPEMLATEQRLIDSATRRQRERTGVAEPGHIDAAIAARPTLSGEQAEMVWKLCAGGAGVEIVEGVAGAGKTYGLAVSHHAWIASGHRVIGCALAARAAQELQTGTGIPSSTLDRLLGELDRPDTNGLTPKHVIVVDEAAMVGSRKLLRLLEHAERAGAKVVLVGDPRQLPEIDAGGAFAGLAERLEPATLAENRRQHEPWERAALAQLRAGDTDKALDAYQTHSRIHHAPDSDTAKNQLVDHWHTARTNDEQPVMLAATRQQVTDLNHRARQRLQASGEVGHDQLARGDVRFAIGDEVLALRNDYRLGVHNGTRGTITDIDRDHHVVHLAVPDGEPLVLPFDYLAAGHLTHGYAMTVHKAQGMTTGRTMLLADDTLTRELAYVALSRGRGRNDLYLAVDDHRAADRHHPEAVREPDHAVREGVRQSAAKTMAIDHGRERSAGRAAPPPERVAADLRRQLTHLERELQRAEQRRDVAQEGLDNLPRFRRADRRSLKTFHTRSLEAATTDIRDLSTSITETRSHLRQVEREVAHERAVPNRPALDEQRRAATRRLEALERPRPIAVPHRSLRGDVGLGL
jgi:Ti-type conjugative transfer relaxase TraA